MTMAMLADALQVIQGVGIVVLLIMAVGAWRQKQDATPVAIQQEVRNCRRECDARMGEIERQAERLRGSVDRDYARKDTIAAELKGINVRLGNIERAVLQQPTVTED